MSIADFWKCSCWEFIAAVEGYRKAHCSPNGGSNSPITPDRYEEMLQKYGHR